MMVGESSRRGTIDMMQIARNSSLPWGSAALSERSLLALLEECNSDASNNRVAYGCCEWKRAVLKISSSPAFRLTGAGVRPKDVKGSLNLFGSVPWASSSLWASR